ncbi:hypothetical protein [Austwickia sp. TVS 96-490-7B]|uniref:hypothetical protein n=1 Tax=Austwickia sp. TVS 96-490-7B TaxID=2830843 RepID=UPI001C58FDC9|nr:hypothetical protein [Austwickia sp. TVS 96-490-7B]
MLAEASPVGVTTIWADLSCGVGRFAVSSAEGIVLSAAGRAPVVGAHGEEKSSAVSVGGG